MNHQRFFLSSFLYGILDKQFFWLAQVNIFSLHHAALQNFKNAFLAHCPSVLTSSICFAQEMGSWVVLVTTEGLTLLALLGCNQQAPPGAAPLWAVRKAAAPAHLTIQPRNRTKYQIGSQCFVSRSLNCATSGTFLSHLHPMLPLEWMASQRHLWVTIQLGKGGTPWIKGWKLQQKQRQNMVNLNTFSVILLWPRPLLQVQVTTEQQWKKEGMFSFFLSYMNL